MQLRLRLECSILLLDIPRLQPFVDFFRSRLVVLDAVLERPVTELLEALLEIVFWLLIEEALPHRPRSIVDHSEVDVFRLAFVFRVVVRFEPLDGFNVLLDREAVVILWDVASLSINSRRPKLTIGP